VWLTPHPRDLIQPEGEREREIGLWLGLGSGLGCADGSEDDRGRCK